MNRNEKVVYDYFVKQSIPIKRLSYNFPDFLISPLGVGNYVEVKSLDNPNTRYLSNNQEREFARLNMPIYIYYVKKGKLIGKRQFTALEQLPPKEYMFNVTFEDKEFEFLKKAKGTKTWRQFILDLINYKEEDKK